MVQDVFSILLLFLLIHTGISDSLDNECEEGENCMPLTQCQAIFPFRTDYVFKCKLNVNRVCCPTPSQTTKPSPIILPEDCGISMTASRLLPTEDAELGEFPWVALLLYRSKLNPAQTEFLCTASLISNRYVLTAAHCMIQRNFGPPISVRLGEFDLAQVTDCYLEECSTARDIDVESVVSHELYNKPYLKNDIALVRLKEIVSFTQYMRPICLPIGKTVTGNEIRKYRIMGWNTDQRNNGIRDVLQKALVSGVNKSQCNAVQSPRVRPINDLQLCAGGFGGYNVCRGDSGGPLTDFLLDTKGTLRVYQLGIVSFGTEPCGSTSPSVFTKVTMYINWIQSKLMP